MARRAPWGITVLALAPFLVAASDPAGDVVGCRPGHVPSVRAAPDLVEARGDIVELGTSARWTLMFAEPLTVPDGDGRPFRVDVVIRDPEVPAVSFAYYRSVNRLVRVDATIDHETEIYLLPEHGTNVFIPPIIEGASMTIQVPGRTLSDDEDLTGTSPGLEELRWTVIVRDQRACDFLGDGLPRQRLVPAPSVEAGTPPAPEGPSALPWIAAGAVAAVVAVVGYVVRRAR